MIVEVLCLDDIAYIICCGLVIVTITDIEQTFFQNLRVLKDSDVVSKTDAQKLCQRKSGKLVNCNWRIVSVSLLHKLEESSTAIVVLSVNSPIPIGELLSMKFQAS